MSCVLLVCGEPVCGRRGSRQQQPQMSRLENSVDSKDLLCLATELARIVIAQLPNGTQSVVLDVDATVDPCHGQQELESVQRLL